MVLLLSLSVHDSAHAWTALKQGDPTADSQGRISLNLNMVPLPPLDGSHIVEWALPDGRGHRYMAAIAPYGTMILLALVVSGLLSRILSPILKLVLGLLFALAL